MKKSIFNKFAAFILITTFCFAVITANNLRAKSLNPNDDPEIIELMANKLAKKLLLSEEQTVKVVEILNEYFEATSDGNDSNSEELKKAASAKISALLDKKQKMKFDIIETDWWKSAEK